MHHDEKLKQKLVTFIQDAYAMENQIVEDLTKQAEHAKKHPQIQQRIQEHVDATKQHRARMEQRLEAYGEKPSKVKGLLTNMMGNMQGSLGNSSPDSLAMEARNDFVIENFEISTYALLISTAQLYGDQETMQACELNLHDELVMREWLQQHIVEACFLSLRESGIDVPDNAFKEAQATIQSALKSGGVPGMDQGPITQQQSLVGGPA